MRKKLTLWDGIKSIFIQTLFKKKLITSLSVVSATYREVEIRFTYLYFYSSFCSRLIANETERKFKEFYCLASEKKENSIARNYKKKSRKMMDNFVQKKITRNVSGFSCTMVILQSLISKHVDSILR